MPCRRLYVRSRSKNENNDYSIMTLRDELITKMATMTDDQLDTLNRCADSIKNPKLGYDDFISPICLADQKVDQIIAYTNAGISIGKWVSEGWDGHEFRLNFEFFPGIYTSKGTHCMICDPVEEYLSYEDFNPGVKISCSDDKLTISLGKVRSH